MTWSDGYFGKIFLDEVEGVAARGRYQGPGRSGWGPGVGQGPRKPSLTLRQILWMLLSPGSFQLKETSPRSSLSFLPATHEISFLSLFHFREKKPTLCS